MNKYIKAFINDSGILTKYSVISANGVSFQEPYGYAVLRVDDTLGIAIMDLETLAHSRDEALKLSRQAHGSVAYHEDHPVIGVAKIQLRIQSIEPL